MTAPMEESVSPVLPEGFVPGSVAPFMMRYGTGFLLAMQRAAVAHDAARSPDETETA